MLRTFVCKCEQEGTYMKTAKTYRIKSRLRFTVFIALMIIITVSSTNTMLGLYDASSLTVKEYKSVEICSGDTLWQLAKEHMPSDMDTRRAVHQICNLNDIAAADIYPGQTIQIPVYH